MHRVDTDGHVSNLFNEGDPLVPRNPTQVDKHILNAFQEELANAIETAGITLVKGTNNQLARALGLLGSGARAGVARYFSAALDILVGAARGLTVSGSPGGTTGVAYVENTGSSVSVKLGTSSRAVSADGPIETNSALITRYLTFDVVTVTTLPSTSDFPAGTVLYVAGALNKLYFNDPATAAWIALW